MNVGKTEYSYMEVMSRSMNNLSVVILYPRVRLLSHLLLWLVHFCLEEINVVFFLKIL